MRRTLFELIVIGIGRMTRNDPLTEQEWLIHPRSAVDSAQYDLYIMSDGYKAGENFEYLRVFY